MTDNRAFLDRDIEALKFGLIGIPASFLWPVAVVWILGMALFGIYKAFRGGPAHA